MPKILILLFKVISGIAAMAKDVQTIKADVKTILERIDVMANKYDELIAEVSRETDIVVSVKTAMDTLIAEVEANKDDPVELANIVTAYRAQNDELAAAVANVPGPEPTE